MNNVKHIKIEKITIITRSNSYDMSPHLEIDCVDPLPPVATYNSINATPSIHDLFVLFLYMIICMIICAFN